MLSAGGGAGVASPCHNIHHLCYSITIIASTIANITTAITIIIASVITNIFTTIAIVIAITITQ